MNYLPVHLSPLTVSNSTGFCSLIQFCRRASPLFHVVYCFRMNWSTSGTNISPSPAAPQMRMGPAWLSAGRSAVFAVTRGIIRQVPKRSLRPPSVIAQRSDLGDEDDTDKVWQPNNRTGPWAGQASNLPHKSTRTFLTGGLQRPLTYFWNNYQT